MVCLVLFTSRASSPFRFSADWQGVASPRLPDTDHFTLLCTLQSALLGADGSGAELLAQVLREPISVSFAEPQEPSRKRIGFALRLWHRLKSSVFRRKGCACHWMLSSCTKCSGATWPESWAFAVFRRLGSAIARSAQVPKSCESAFIPAECQQLPTTSRALLALALAVLCRRQEHRSKRRSQALQALQITHPRFNNIAREWRCKWSADGEKVAADR